jgi:hypothetical protein
MAGKNKFIETLKSYADAVGKKPEDVAKALEGLVGSDEKTAGDVLKNHDAVTDEEIQAALVGTGDGQVPLGVYRMNAKLLRDPKAVPASGTNGGGPVLTLLPTLPESDAKFLEELRVGGILEPEPNDVLAAVRAGFAQRFEFFNLPQTIRDKMEEFAYANDKSCGAEYYEMEKMVTSRQYGDVLSATGVTGSFVSVRKRKEFLRRVDVYLWASINDFHNTLNSWMTGWQATANNPTALLSALSGNGANNPLAQLATQAPDLSPVRDAAESVVNNINKVFAGPGIPVARALAYDAVKITEVLENEKLPALLGAGNKEQMLKELGVAVGSDHVRLQHNLAKYAFGIMSLEKVTAEEEQMYALQMYQLGVAIPWEKVLGNQHAEVA